MAYRIEITQRANELLDNIIYYVAVKLNNPGAAEAILDDVAETIAYCEDPVLSSKGFRKILLKNHDYVMLYKVLGDVVMVEGIFHELENYGIKL